VRVRVNAGEQGARVCGVCTSVPTALYKLLYEVLLRQRGRRAVLAGLGAQAAACRHATRVSHVVAKACEHLQRSVNRTEQDRAADGSGQQSHAYSTVSGPIFS
jgi:hypothetical protein